MLLGHSLRFHLCYLLTNVCQNYGNWTASGVEVYAFLCTIPMENVSFINTSLVCLGAWDDFICKWSTLWTFNACREIPWACKLSQGQNSWVGLPTWTAFIWNTRYSKRTNAALVLIASKKSILRILYRKLTSSVRNHIATSWYKGSHMNRRVSCNTCLSTVDASIIGCHFKGFVFTYLHSFIRDCWNCFDSSFVLQAPTLWLHEMPYVRMGPIRFFQQASNAPCSRNAEHKRFETGKRAGRP